MSPPSTAAARRSSARRAPTARGSQPRRAPSRPAARRVSGPARARAVAATAGAAGRPVALPRPRAFPGRLGARVRALPDHRLLHRLIGGRAWIPVVAMALLGIVALQVSMLRLNSQIGRSVARESVLERQNTALRAGNGRLSDEQRVRQVAAQAGLMNPGTGSIRFLRVRGGDARRAVAAMKPPLVASTSTLGAATATTPATTPTPTPPVNPVASTTPTTPTTPTSPPATPSTTPTQPPPTAATTPTQAPATSTTPTTTTTPMPSASVAGEPTAALPGSTTGGAGTP